MYAATPQVTGSHESKPSKAGASENSSSRQPGEYGLVDSAIVGKMLLSLCTDVSRRDDRGGGCGVDGGAPSTRSGDVVLRDVTEGDLAIFFEHQRDPVANRMADFPPRDRDAFRAHWTKILADESVAKKTILFDGRLFDGRVAGNVVSFEQDGE